MQSSPKYRSLFFYLAHRYLTGSLPAAPRVIAGSDRAYGIDISHWESSFDPLLSMPGLLDFAIFKATEGATWKDDRFESFYAAAKPAVPVLGAYHYLRSQYSAEVQIGNFLSAIAGKRFDILVCDFESALNNLTDEFVRKAHVFGQGVRAALPGVRLLFYTNPSTYDNVVFPASQRLFGRDVFLGEPWDGFWVAQYYFVPSPAKSPTMPKTRSDWVLWQYSESGDPDLHGTGGWCDQNVFNGSPAQFSAWVGSDSPPPPPPPSNGDSSMTDTVFSNGVRVLAGRAYDTDFRAVIIPANAIAEARYVYVKPGGMYAEEVDGDFVFNLTPFEVSGSSFLPTMGLRMGGTELVPYKNYNPYLAWASGNLAVFTSNAKNFKLYQHASQVFRILVQNGAINEAWDDNPDRVAEWKEKHPRRLVGRTPGGSTVVVSCKGRVLGEQAGWSLLESTEFLINVCGCDFAGDGDGGVSVQDYLKINGAPDVFLGVESGRRKVAVVGTIKLKSPLVSETPPPPPPTGSATLVEYDEFGDYVQTWVPKS